MSAAANSLTTLGHHVAKHTETEQNTADALCEAFERSPVPLAMRLQNFARHVRRHLVRRRYRHRPPRPLGQRLAAGEERRRVPVGPHAQQDEVERRAPGPGVGERVAAEQRVVAVGRVGRRALPLDARHLRLGDRDAPEQRLARHPVVAVRVVGRHAPLVAEPHVRGRPRHRRQLGEALVGDPRRGAPGERDHEPPALGRRAPRRVGDELRRAPGHRVGVGEHHALDPRRHA